MAPMIPIRAEETLETIENVLKRWRDVNWILKEKEKEMLSGKDYQHMEVDLNKKWFLRPLDSDNTKANVYYIRQKFTSYARHWHTFILEKNYKNGRMMSFLHWICETHLAKKWKKGKRKSVNQYW
ncbi:hypothetical protein HOY82DRAFT_614070 [Tuber indicum]|nr:hypothetical protein HOY82DRAFT_614070 [Tuber indicum]